MSHPFHFESTPETRNRSSYVPPMHDPYRFSTESHPPVSSVDNKPQTISDSAVRKMRDLRTDSRENTFTNLAQHVQNIWVKVDAFLNSSALEESLNLESIIQRSTRYREFISEIADTTIKLQEEYSIIGQKKVYENGKAESGDNLDEEMYKNIKEKLDIMNQDLYSRQKDVSTQIASHARNYYYDLMDDKERYRVLYQQTVSDLHGSDFSSSLDTSRHFSSALQLLDQRITTLLDTFHRAQSLDKQLATNNSFKTSWQLDKDIEFFHTQKKELEFLMEVYPSFSDTSRKGDQKENNEHDDHYHGVFTLFSDSSQLLQMENVGYVAQSYRKTLKEAQDVDSKYDLSGTLYQKRASLQQKLEKTAREIQSPSCDESTKMLHNEYAQALEILDAYGKSKTDYVCACETRLNKLYGRRKLCDNLIRRYLGLKNLFEEDTNFSRLLQIDEKNEPLKHSAFASLLNDKLYLLKRYHDKLASECQQESRNILTSSNDLWPPDDIIHEYIPGYLLQEKALKGTFIPAEAYGTMPCGPASITVLYGLYHPEGPTPELFDRIYHHYVPLRAKVTGTYGFEIADALNRLQLPIQDQQGRSVQFKNVRLAADSSQMRAYLNVRDKHGIRIPVIVDVRNPDSGHIMVVRANESDGVDIWSPYVGYSLNQLDPLLDAMSRPRYEPIYERDTERNMIQQKLTYRVDDGTVGFRQDSLSSSGAKSSVSSSAIYKRVLSCLSVGQGKYEKRALSYEEDGKMRELLKVAKNHPAPFADDERREPKRDFSNNFILESFMDIVVPYFSDEEPMEG